MTVRLLLDQNVSPRLARALADLYPGSLHVSDAGLDSAADGQIWEFAGDQGFIIVTKDRGFREFSLDLGAPPKLIWVGLGNRATARIEDKLRPEAIRVSQFAEDPAASLLVLR